MLVFYFILFLYFILIKETDPLEKEVIKRKTEDRGVYALKF